MSAARKVAGTSLAEVLIVMAVLGVLLSFGVPRTRHAFETARVDNAGATLRSIWSAQRMFWLETRTYASSLQTLAELRLVDVRLTDTTEPFGYAMLTADDATFVARAVRNGSDVYRGALEIDETGDITGEIEDDQGRVFTPVGSD